MHGPWNDPGSVHYFTYSHGISHFISTEHEHGALPRLDSVDYQCFICKQFARMNDAGVAYSTLTLGGAAIANVEADRMKLVSSVMVCNMHADE